MLETRRLVLRAYLPRDIDDIASMYGDSEVMAYTKLGRQSLEQVRPLLAQYVQAWQERDFGMRAVLLKPNLEFAGECGLFLLPGEEAALRYAFQRRFWGVGIAGEAVAATVDDAFEATSLAHVVSLVQTRNAASLSVMRKLEWEVVGTEMDGEVELLRFRRTRKEWAGTRSDKC